ncbi:MAG TPA: hypothetical protein VGD33_01685 [Chitinophagaceae bacterium]
MIKKLLTVAAILTLQIGFAQPTGYPDSVRMKASTKYQNPSFIKRIFLGKNYRQEWETTVTLPVFYLKQMGFTIKELGGGQQTKSLRLEDKKGKEWVLRTVDKDVELALPKLLRNTIAESITQDMVSAAHPYAPLTIPTLARSINVITAVPKFYYIPDDPAFGEHRSLFAHTMCMLEQREPTPDNSDTKGTDKVLEDIIEENDHLVIQQAVLRARILDMLVGDWDRHADQWRWGVVEQGGVDYYYAIPRDRDQAFFYSGGLLPKLVRPIAMKHLVGFTDNLDKLKNLNRKSWYFDGVFLNELDRNEWESTLKWVQSKLTDEVIHNAIMKMPPEIYAIRGKEIELKLKGRRDDLHQMGMKYYKFISEEVNVTGTEEEEIFKISGNKEKLLVQVFAKKQGDGERKIYERVFYGETRIINLQGLAGKDDFQIEENTVSNIQLNLSGGEGEDKYDIKGSVNNAIIDNKGELNTIINKSNSRIQIK